MRFSKQREEISKVLKGTTCHPDADWIYREVKKELPNISLGTVYRNLKEMSESGTILTLETQKSKICYDGDVSCHSHFVCNKCGKIVDIFETSGLKDSLAREGHSVESEKSVLYGTCKSCNEYFS